MTEPPAKRARRTDSSAMWDMNDKTSRSVDRSADRITKELDTVPKRDTTFKEDTKRANGSRESRDDRRNRSHSPMREDWRRDRSRSRDRKGRSGPREGRRDTGRDRHVRDRDRSTSRDRQYPRRDHLPKTGRHRDRSQSRSRSRSPARNGPKVRTRSPPRGPKSDWKDTTKESRIREDGKGANGSARHAEISKLVDNTDVDSQDVDGEAEDFDQLIGKTMGFSSFRSTQNTKVPGNNMYGVRKEKKTVYRQYMNRKGGFNRPLSPSR